MIEFHPLALLELRRAQAWYRDKSLQAAERYFEQTSRTIDRILSDPASHAPFGQKWRYVRVARFPYVLIYRVRQENDVYIIAVAHTSRRRGYWRKRK